MPASATVMSAALLLAGHDSGEVRRLYGIRVAKEPPVLELERIKVNRAPVNEDHNSELALSARHAGTIALRLLFRELNKNDPVTRLWFDIEAPSTPVTGRSAELFFGLATYLHLGRDDLPAGIPNANFMATGTLDPDGNVGSVDQVAVKVRAALAASGSSGSKLFYPRIDEAQIDDTLRLQCRDHGLLLCPVDRIDEALAMLGVPIIGSWPSGVSPFRSLQAFDTSFSRVFFGRQSEVAALASLLDARAAAGKPGALIIGASGAGKSSFCLAGLIPALSKSRPALAYAVWRPRAAVAGRGDDPADERHIAQSIGGQWRLRDANQPGLAMARTADGIDCLASLPDCLAPTISDGSIFIVDQFEELFTLAFTPEARIAFARFLQSLQAKGIWVIGTLRSEFYPQYLELTDTDGVPVLTPMFEGDGQYNLPRMSREALAQVIVRPAELAGLRFEQRSDEVTLAHAVLADAMATDDALPLLGFALQTLYDEAERPAPGDNRDAAAARTLTFAAYDRLGGLGGAIGVVAARAYGALDAAAQAELPALLSALAVPSPDGSRETARPAPSAQWPVGSPGRRLIDALTDIRVLVSERGAGVAAAAQVRVAHEALLSHWDLATQVLNDSRQNRMLIEDFRRRADQWDAAGRHRGALLSSPRDLENARAIGPTLLEVESHAPLLTFVQASLARARATRRLRAGAAATMALMLVSLTAWALYGQQVAAKQTEIAREQTHVARQALADATRQRRAAEGATRRAVAEADRAESASAKAEQRQKEAEAARAGEAQQRRIAEQNLAAANVARSSEARQLRVALDQRSRAVAQLAEQAIERGDAMTGILLARSQLRPGEEASWSISAQATLLRAIFANRETNALTGHRMIMDAAFSPDGRRVVTAAADNTARIWSIDGTLGLPIVLSGHTGGVTSAEFSADGRQVVTASYDRTARVWDANDGRLVSVLAGHLQWVHRARFSRDGTRVVTTSGDSTARLWTIGRDGARSVILTGHTDYVASAEFSPDGRQIVTASGDHTARVWTLDGDRISSVVLSGHGDRLQHALFSPDGRKIITTATNGEVRVWQVGGMDHESILLPGYDGELIQPSFSPDGHRVIVAAYGGSEARVWTLDGERPNFISLSGHESPISSVEFSADGQHVVTASEDGMVRVWTLNESGATAIVLHAHDDRISTATFDREGSRLLTASLDGVARIWALSDARASDAILLHDDRVLSATYTPSHHYLIVGSANRKLRIWWSLGDQPQSFELPGSQHYSVLATSTDPERLRMVVPYGSDARIWTFDGRMASFVELDNPTHMSIEAAAFDPAGNVLTATQNGEVRAWTVSEGQASSVILSPLDPTLPIPRATAPTTMAFSPDASRLLVVPTTEAPRIYTLDRSGAPTILLLGHGARVHGASFSPDGRRILTASDDRTARIWTIGREGATSIVLSGHEGGVTDARFSPDGLRVLTLSSDNTVRVWDAANANELAVFSVHRPRSAYFSPDGRRVVTTSWFSNSVQVWTVEGDPTRPLTLTGHLDRVLTALFSEDGNHVVTASDDRTVRVWHVPIGRDLLAMSNAMITRCLTNSQLQAAGLDERSGFRRRQVTAPPC